MKGNLIGFAVSAIIHTGLVLLLVFGLSVNSTPQKIEESVPLRLAMFQEAEPEPIVKQEVKPVEPKPIAKQHAKLEVKEKPIPKVKPKPKKKRVKKEPKIKAKPKKVAKKPTKKSDKKLDEMISSLQSQKAVKQPTKRRAKTPTKKTNNKQTVKAKNNPAIEQQYKARLRRLIASYKKYPARAKRNGDEGTVMLAFSLSANGNISNIRVTQSSGSNSLDQAAMSTLKKISGKLPFPVGINRKQWQLSLPLVYHLR